MQRDLQEESDGEPMIGRGREDLVPEGFEQFGNRLVSAEQCVDSCEKDHVSEFERLLDRRDRLDRR